MEDSGVNKISSLGGRNIIMAGLFFTRLVGPLKQGRLY